MDKTNKLINSLLHSIEEYVACFQGFANLGEALAYKEGCELVGRPMPEFIGKLLEEMVGDY